jgi:hypothetical protein
MLALHKLQRHRHQSSVRPIEMRSQVDLGTRRIPGGKVDHLNLPLEIECEKVAGMLRAIALARYRIDLVVRG